MGSWWPWCRHKWTVEEEWQVLTEDGSRILYIDKHLRCEKCGDWKKVRL